MTPKIQTAIDALVDSLREESPEQMTTFRLFVNCEERVIETAERTPAELKAAGISMRNLRGNFIRENDEMRDRHLKQTPPEKGSVQ
jgi:hypothetical protein